MAIVVTINLSFIRLVKQWAEILNEMQPDIATRPSFLERDRQLRRKIVGVKENSGQFSSKRAV